MAAIIIDATGVRPIPDPSEVRRQIEVQSFFWLDVFGGDELLRSAHINQFGLETPEVAWALRFGQTGRIQIGRDRIRVVTWMADSRGNILEVHLAGWRRHLLTVWSGDPAALDEIRRQFSERACGYESNLFHSAAILLQLLLGTLDSAIHAIDLALDDLRLHIDARSGAADFASLTGRLRRLQSIAANFDRYASAVRTATVGIETAPGMDAHAATEFNDYVEQAEDVAEQFYERRRWMSDLMHDYATAIAQRQGEQINRLTVVSMIFLPLSAVTGFFGMNFDWLNRNLVSEQSFWLLGVLLPLACVLATFLWLWRRGLIRLFGGRAAPARDLAREPETPRFALDIDVALPPRLVDEGPR